MFVELRELKPNPMRDFTVDPMDEDRIGDLCTSIEEDGFWGGIVCRQVADGTIQIGAGHHRVSAAIRAGVRTADVFVGNGDMDDAAMVRVYARENATQRGNTGTAQAGSVASALRFIAKCLMVGVSPQLGRNHDIPKLRGNLTSEKGLGQDVIASFLKSVPGINSKTVEQALANLKASGDYARIIAEVQQEIERENAEALKALEEAEREQVRLEKEREEAEERQRKAESARKEAAAQARVAREEADRRRAAAASQKAELDRQRAEAAAQLAEKRRKQAAEEMKKFAAKRDAGASASRTAAKAVAAADKRPITFDFEGVAKHLKNAHQIDAFRQCVTGEGIAPYLAVDKQADLAAHLVKLAKERSTKDRPVELSAAFIRENVISQVLHVKGDQRQFDAEEKERIGRNDKLARARQHMHDFCRSCHGMASYGKKIEELIKDWPNGLAFPITGEFRSALESAKKIIDALLART